MRHPSEGVLRRLVDEPAGVTDADRRHVASCPACLAELDGVRSQAQLVGAALAPASTGIDPDAAWARLTATAAAAPAPKVPARRQVPARSGRERWRAAVRRPAIAVLSTVVVLTGAGV